MSQKEFLQKKIRDYEKEHMKSVAEDPWRLRFHLMPPVGWLNDPNGLCQCGGVYHIFFQYSPFHVKGGDKFWGHYVSKDLKNYTYLGAPLVTDQKFDADGVYSGSAWVEDEKILLYYTGNVKEKGDFDYIHKGRGANTVLLECEGGKYFGEKQLLMTNEDYPEGLTQHVRDPKVWKEDGIYYMVQGARKNNDQGIVLLFASEDGKAWEFKKEFQSGAFGYMWECPDLFQAGKNYFLSVSPQGLKREEKRYQNVYQSGYFRIRGDYRGECRLEDFEEWDYGFDFYAPQTFLDENGRRILYGWVGMPDAEEEYTNPTVERGWQHALTLPREITEKEGRLYQYPVGEIQKLRKEQQTLTAGEEKETHSCFDLELTGICGEAFSVEILEGLSVEWKDKTVRLSLSKEAGAGRKVRMAELDRLSELRVVADTSLVEIYFNHGEKVMTTRFYPEGEKRTVRFSGEASRAELWDMDGFVVEYPQKED